MRVGTRELKNHFTQYLRKVAAGEVVFVTSRGRVIAEIRAVDESVEDAEERHLRALEEQGILMRPKQRRRRLPDFEPIRVDGDFSLSQAVSDDRDG